MPLYVCLVSDECSYLLTRCNLFVVTSDISNIGPKRTIFDGFTSNNDYIQDGGGRFTYRVGGILLHNGHVLCQRADTNDFWFLPGGRAELGLAVHVERLVYVLENFFRSTHELGLYFLITAPADSYLYHSLATFEREDDVGHRLYFDWLSTAQLAGLTLCPAFFQTALQHLPEPTTHRVYIDTLIARHP